MNFSTASLLNSSMHAKNMEWTNDDALELIEQYRSHTELWNRADPKYKDKLCRFRAWSEIAERFGCSKAEVERKMNVLLTQYRREKHKMFVKLYQGVQPNPSKWYAFKRFDFMESVAGSTSAIVAGIAGSGGVGGGGGGVTGATGVGRGLNVSLNSGITSSSSGGNSTNGHRHHHHHHHAAAAATAAALNGLSVAGYDTTTAAAAATTSSHHRRIKSKEMKYFGSMGLNLPMLLGNSQPLEAWNPVSQFSPSHISERNHQLRVPLPITFPTAAPTDLNTSGGSGTGGHSLFGDSDFTGSPQKPMDTTDIENDEGKENNSKCEHTTPSNTRNTSAASNDGRLSAGRNDAPVAPVGEGATCSGDMDSVAMNTSSGSAGGDVGACRRSDDTPGTEVGSSPIPNTNTFEAHKQRHLIPGGAVRSDSQGRDDLDIKQELLENYFQAPHPPPPPDSHRSYSSTDDNRHGNDSTEDFAQDLRVSVAAAAAAKGLDFRRYVLPPSLRRSTDSIDEKFIPLNMRKLNPASVASSHAGQMLMNSLLSSESISEENTTMSVCTKSGNINGNPNGSSQDASSSAAAAAAAAAIYAESLNRDDCDFIGSNVSVKLRTMDRTQRIIAEKLISEVLYYGQFNELERSARIQPK